MRDSVKPVVDDLECMVCRFQDLGEQHLIDLIVLRNEDFGLLSGRAFGCNRFKRERFRGIAQVLWVN